MPTRLRDIVRAPKTEIRLGALKAGKVPRADFPMAKKAYSLGASVEWCVIQFTALDLACRVLVMFNPQKERFQAVLGAMCDELLTILCTYEYHATEPGWHCHAACRDVRTLSAGCMRAPWVQRIPSPKSTHAHMDFGVASKTEAQHRALDFFKIAEQGSLL